MTFKVYGTISKTFQRVFDVPERTIEIGPYKRLKTAKRKAREWRASRVETIEEINGLSTDHGPWFKKVWIEVIS